VDEGEKTMVAKRMHMITRKAFMFEIFVFIIASSLPLLFIGAMHDISSFGRELTLKVHMRTRRDVHTFVLSNKTTLKSISAFIIATSCYIYIYIQRRTEPTTSCSTLHVDDDSIFHQEGNF
jgi:hypothetical protein